MEEISLSVEARNDRGKGAARRLRRSGKVPAVFYGPKSAATPRGLPSLVLIEQS